MNKKKKILINPKTGEKIIIDRNKPENGGSMTVKDMIFLTELQIKSNQKNFSGFTEEEQKLYSEITKNSRESIAKHTEKADKLRKLKL